MALDTLDPHGRVLVEENSAFSSFADGTLTLEVRLEQWRPIVRERLADVDFVRVLPGFRRLEVRVGGAGATAREVRNAEEERRLQEAKVAAEASAALKRMVALLGGQIETIEASTLDGGDRSHSFEEGSDD